MLYTWIMNGVSFFLLIALSSIVSGTERLIILLLGGKPMIFEQYLVFNLNKYSLWQYSAQHISFSLLVFV